MYNISYYLDINSGGYMTSVFIKASPGTDGLRMRLCNALPESRESNNEAMKRKRKNKGLEFACDISTAALNTYALCTGIFMKQVAL